MSSLFALTPLRVTDVIQVNGLDGQRPQCSAYPLLPLLQTGDPFVDPFSHIPHLSFALPFLCPSLHTSPSKLTPEL